MCHVSAWIRATSSETITKILLVLFPSTLAFYSLNIDFGSFSLPVCATNWIPEAKQAKFSLLIFFFPHDQQKESIKAATPSRCQRSSLAEKKERLQGKLGPCSAVRKEVLLYEKKKSAWLSFTGRRKRQAGNTEWTIFLVERPKSLQTKWEPNFAGSPYLPPPLSKVHSCLGHELTLFERQCFSEEQILFLGTDAPLRWLKFKFKIHIHRTYPGKSSSFANRNFKWIKLLIFGLIQPVTKIAYERFHPFSNCRTCKANHELVLEGTHLSFMNSLPLKSNFCDFLHVKNGHFCLCQYCGLDYPGKLHCLQGGEEAMR